MQTLTVDKLKAGMVVAEPVLTKRGQTISKAGEELTNQLIAKLTFYKIESVSVEDIEEEEVAAEPAPAEEKPAKSPAKPQKS